MWCYIFIKKLNLGIVGAAISMNITLISNMVLLDAYISRREDFKETWLPNDSNSYKEWRAYFKVGFYGAILECLGWWNLHICFLFSGYLGIIEIDT